MTKELKLLIEMIKKTQDMMEFPIKTLHFGGQKEVATEMVELYLNKKFKRGSKVVTIENFDNKMLELTKGSTCGGYGNYTQDTKIEIGILKNGSLKDMYICVSGTFENLTMCKLKLAVDEMKRFYNNTYGVIEKLEVIAENACINTKSAEGGELDLLATNIGIELLCNGYRAKHLKDIFKEGKVHENKEINDKIVESVEGYVKEYELLDTMNSVEGGE